jgi:hypothetical protein
MPAPYCTAKIQRFVMPDGSVKDIEDTHHWKFLVVTADPDYRILVKCSSRKYADNRFAYYRRLWDLSSAGVNIPIWIISRKSFEYVYDGEGYNEPEPLHNPNWQKIGD